MKIAQVDLDMKSSSLLKFSIFTINQNLFFERNKKLLYLKFTLNFEFFEYCDIFN